MLSRFALVLPLTLAIACNKAPEGLTVSLGPDGATTVDDLVLSLATEATDPNKNDEVVYEITWSVDGVEVPELADTYTIPASRTEHGQTWTADVIATDGRKPAEAVSTSIIVANSAPEATFGASPKGDALTTEDLVVTLEASDVDGDEISVTYAWTVDGAASSYDGDTVPADATAKGQTWHVEVTVSDAWDTLDAFTADFDIVNTVPSVGAARVDPQLAYEATTLSCKGGGWRDADGDPATYETAWMVNGSQVSTEATLTGADFDRGDVVACALTPVDDESAGAPMSSASITVRNTQAVVVSGSLVPADPTVDSTLEAKVTGVIDGDGDFAVVRYTWYVNGVELENTASFLEGGAGWFAKGDAVKVWMRGYDGIENGKGPAYTVTVLNTPPSAPEVTVTEGTEGVVCVVATESEDADGDPISYSVTWSVDGVPWTGAVTTGTWMGDTVASEDTAPGETWTCTVVPDDGEEVGSSATAHTVLTGD